MVTVATSATRGALYLFVLMNIAFIDAFTFSTTTATIRTAAMTTTRMLSPPLYAMSNRENEIRKKVREKSYIRCKYNYDNIMIIMMKITKIDDYNNWPLFLLDHGIEKRRKDEKN